MLYRFFPAFPVAPIMQVMPIDNKNTDNSFYNDTVCSKPSLTLKWICCYKEILTITRFQHNNHLVKENIVQLN